MESGYGDGGWISGEEVLELYRQIYDSLSRNRGVYVVDDFLSSIRGIERIPTRYDSGMTCFVVRGRDSTRSVTFLLSASGALHPMRCLERLDGGLHGNSYLNLTAGNLLSACLAMKNVQGRRNKALPVDVYFVLVGNGERKLGYRHFDPQFLRESILDTIGSGTHLIVVESTGLRACIVQKGCLVFRLKIRGRFHHPAYPWLGENPWDVLIRFEESMAGTMKPKHDIYPVEVGRAPPIMLSNFMIGYPTMTPLQVEYVQPHLFGENSSIETEYYVCVPPEFSYKDFESKLSSVLEEVARGSGCEASVDVIYEEQPFREDPQSVIVNATSSAFLRLTGFEPVFEWLPHPVSANDLISSGFAKDIMVLGPGDWTLSSTQDEKTIIAEVLRAAEILETIPYEAALLQERQQAK